MKLKFSQEDTFNAYAEASDPPLCVYTHMVCVCVCTWCVFLCVHVYGVCVHVHGVCVCVCTSGETLFIDISEVNRQVIYRNRSAGQNISQYIECTRQDKMYIAIYRMHSGGSDQTMNILVYIPTHHSELEKKEKAVG